MNQDDFMYGYEIGRTEQQFPTRTYFNEGRAVGSSIGKGIASLIGGLLNLAIQLGMVSVKGILRLVPVLFTVMKRAIPKTK